VPGTVRISFSVGMAGNLHHRAPAWYACRDGPVASVASRGARGADGAEPAQLPRSVPPFAVLPALSASLHLSDTRAGVLQTLFIVSYMLVSPLAGWLGDRTGRFGVASVGVLVW